MAVKTILGRVGFVDKGMWDANRAFDPMDIVTHDNAVWNCLVGNSGQEPGGGNEYWRKWIEGTGAADGKTLVYNPDSGKIQAVDVLLASGKTAKEMGQIGPAANNPAGITSMDQLVEEGLYCFTTGAPADFPVGGNGFVRVITGGNGYVKQFAFRMGTPGSNDFDAACRTLSVNASGAVVTSGPWWKLGTIKFAVYSAASGSVDTYAVNISSVSLVATGQYRLRLIHPVPAANFAPLVTTPGNVGGFGVASRVDTEGYTWDVYTYNGSGAAANRLFRAVSL